MGELSATERTIARHALGLPNERKGSYRNRYITYLKSDEWERMITKGFAAIEFLHTGPRIQRLYYLSQQGALAALEPGESLCPEDFPAAKATP